MLKKFRLFKGNRLCSIAIGALVIFGSLMIASAEMGNGVGDSKYLQAQIIRQLEYALAAFIVYVVFMHIRVSNVHIVVYWALYILILAALLACRFMGQINGAYAWIPIGGGSTIQPSEFAKVFMICFASKLFRKNNDDILKTFKTYAVCAAFYVFIILFIQHDTGSAVVLFGICYLLMMIPSYPKLKKTQNIMTLLVIAGLLFIVIMLSNPVTEFLKKFQDDYRIARFLVAADPFLYRYDNGYHIIMSLVSFANGGIFGLGYGNSIHKYMNFPNPSNDFILPVIVEELGIVGFVLLVALYGLMLYPIIISSFRCKYMSSRIILFGTFLYFAIHFILNVGGVSGFIPLTGVPLLIISSGGSSLVASMAVLGLSQSEIERNGEFDESNRG